MGEERPSLFNPDEANADSAKSQAPANSKMTFLTRIFTIEKSFATETEKFREEIENLRKEIEAAGLSDSQTINIHRNGKNPTHETNGEIGQHKGQAGSKIAAESNGDANPKRTAKWQPLAVRKMSALDSPPLSSQPLPLDKMTSFTMGFLHGLFGGDKFSPGVFFPASEAKTHSKQFKEWLKTKTYYLMEAEKEPFLPKEPGQHGAKLTVFFRDSYEDQVTHQEVPLFIALPGNKSEKGEALYTYFGHYSQTRWSDKLDYDTQEEVVPPHVKEYWADMLVHPNRPAWVTKALMEHFWPMPKYDGPVPEVNDENALETPEIKQEMKEFLLDLAEWDKEAKMKLQLLKKENIMDAFAAADAATEPGIRFYWEYLQCIGFERNFYYVLANMNSSAAKGGNDTAKSNTADA